VAEQISIMRMNATLSISIHEKRGAEPRATIDLFSDGLSRYFEAGEDTFERQSSIAPRDAPSTLKVSL
jgi:hypothetical protein